MMRTKIYKKPNSSYLDKDIMFFLNDKILKDKKIYFIDDLMYKFDANVITYEDDDTDKVGGFYVQENNEIYVNTFDNTMDDQRITLLHEFSHFLQYYCNKIHNGNTLSDKIFFEQQACVITYELTKKLKNDTFNPDGIFPYFEEYCFDWYKDYLKEYVENDIGDYNEFI